MRRIIVICLLLACLALGADITGTWSMTVETDMGSGSPTFVFKQEGENLSGTYTGQLGEAKVTGTLRGDVIEFWFEASPSGESM
jgi:hypothetical protein